jgi:hypothetical protein
LFSQIQRREIWIQKKYVPFIQVSKKVSQLSHSKKKNINTKIMTTMTKQYSAFHNEQCGSPSALSRFVELFLRGDELVHLMRHFCNTSMGQVVDPITDVVCVMITSPLQIVITEVGVAPFKDRPTRIYPFVEMNENQRTFLREIVQSHLDCADGGKRANDRVATTTTTSISFASLQMGGGFVIEFQPASKHQTKKRSRDDTHQQCDASSILYLNAEDVLRCMCRAILTPDNGHHHSQWDTWRRSV